MSANEQFIVQLNEKYYLGFTTIWGIGMGVQGLIMKTIIADRISTDKRATAFGTFYTFFGIAWFAGSAYMGYLYDRSVMGFVIFSLNMQSISIAFLFSDVYHFAYFCVTRLN